MISLLVSFLILLLVVGLVWWAITQIPLPPPLKMMAQVVLVIIVLLVLLGYLIPYAHHPGL